MPVRSASQCRLRHRTRTSSSLRRCSAGLASRICSRLIRPSPSASSGSPGGQPSWTSDIELAEPMKHPPLGWLLCAMLTGAIPDLLDTKFLYIASFCTPSRYPRRNLFSCFRFHFPYLVSKLHHYGQPL